MPLKCDDYRAGRVSAKGQFFFQRSPTNCVRVCARACVLHDYILAFTVYSGDVDWKMCSLLTKY